MRFELKLVRDNGSVIWKAVLPTDAETKYHFTLPAIDGAQTLRGFTLTPVTEGPALPWEETTDA